MSVGNDISRSYRHPNTPKWNAAAKEVQKLFNAAQDNVVDCRGVQPCKCTKRLDSGYIPAMGDVESCPTCGLVRKKL